MAKRCKHWKKASCSVEPLDKGYKKYRRVYVNCPKNVTPNCYYKNKTKMVKIKGWARTYGYGEVFADNFNKDDGMPCTILIDRKYLKGEK